MRRADRLFKIVEFLKSRRRAVTAKIIAEEFEVNIRTVYRDIADLQLSGVPVIGEAGVGYMLNQDYIVRPLMFDIEEIEALVLGAQMVKSWADPALAKAARQSLNKITAIVPKERRSDMEDTALFSLPSQAKTEITIDSTALRHAIRLKKLVKFDYDKESKHRSSRHVRPLALAFFGPVWLLLGWCESRKDFRNFRLDRMKKLHITEEHFQDEQSKTLADFLRQ